MHDFVSQLSCCSVFFFYSQSNIVINKQTLFQLDVPRSEKKKLFTIKNKYYLYWIELS